MKLKRINAKKYFFVINDYKFYLVKMNKKWISGKFHFMDRRNGIIDLYFFGDNYNHICRENNKSYHLFDEIYEICDKDLIVDNALKVLDQ